MRHLLWTGGIMALPLAWLLRDPLLMQWRPLLMPLLWLTSLAVSGALCIPCQRAGEAPIQRRGLLALWLLVLGLVCHQQATFHWHKRQVLSASAADIELLGAHLVIGYQHPEEVKQLVQKGLVAGVFIGANQVTGPSQRAIHAAIADLQGLQKGARLIISTDQEGGIVSRMSPPLTKLSPLAEVIGAARQEEIADLAFAYGAQQGQELASLGVNINFSPLADLSLPNARDRLDFHSLIARRAIDADPLRVSAAVVAYARGLESQGVHATLKHFPGLGRVRADTHLFAATLDAGEAALEASDWIPFRQGLRSTQSLLMVGHATLSAVDANAPASLSKKVIQGIVRERWGHQGVLVTDDMAMRPVLQHGLCAASVDALNAGIDLLLVSYDSDQYYEVAHCLLQARHAGRLHPQTLQASGERLARLRAALPI